MEIEDKTKLKTHKCGCSMKQDGIRWVIWTYCKTHQPNFQKKADKLMHKRNKKEGRGYTKSNKK
jgi:hypothetical protein